MSLHIFRSAVSRIIIGIVVIVVIALVIALARGYRLDFQKKTLSSTGILAITSTPKAAKVYLNGELKGVTDLNLTLIPGSYTIEIKKDGYTSYKTKVLLKGELVQAIDPVLFPTNPSLSPLTNLGIVKAVQVNQSDEIIIFSQDNPDGQDGIYLFDSGNRPINIFPPLKPLLMKKNLLLGVDFANSKVYFSYDYKQVIVDFPLEDLGTSISYLISLDTENQQPFDVTNSKDTLLTAWQKQKDLDTQKILESFPKGIDKVASSSFEVVSFSPDQNKIFYQAGHDVALPRVILPPLIASKQTPEQRDLQMGAFYVYDRKEDKNFRIGSEKLDPQTFRWYPDSKHLVFKEGKLLTVLDYDGTNRQVVYSGPIEENFFAVNSGGSFMILANLNPQSNKLPDLYQVGVK